MRYEGRGKGERVWGVGEVQDPHFSDAARLDRCDALLARHDEPRRLFRRKNAQRMIPERERGVRAPQYRLMSQMDTIEETYRQTSQTLQTS